MHALDLPPDLSGRLLDYFDVPDERMAFLLAGPRKDDGGWTAVSELYLKDGLDYTYQGILGMQLADHVRPQVLQWAAETGAALVEVHSHGRSLTPTSFSPTDIDGLRDIVPQLLWRLGGQPYAAIVLGADDLDAVAWSGRGAQARTLAHVSLGGRTVAPTGAAEAVLNSKEAP